MMYDLCFCGDIYADDPSNLFIGEKLEKIFSSSKYVIANLEAPIVIDKDLKPMNKYSALKTKPEIVRFLKKMNVKVVSLANNHIMDYGIEAADYTKEILAKENIMNYGYGKTIEEAFSPCIVNVNGKKIGIIGLATTFVPEALSKRDKPGIAGIRVITKVIIDPREVLEEPAPPYIVKGEILNEDIEHLKSIIKDNKRKFDYIIVHPHWGVGLAPYNKVVVEYVKELAKNIIDFGGDIIVGGHPHAIQPIEAYNGKLIFYSLGNFIFYPLMNEMENLGLVLGIKLDNRSLDIYFVEQKYNCIEILDNIRERVEIKYFKYLISANKLELKESDSHFELTF
ncbi:MAG: CapA family protein [Nitrososphaeria archaeon]|nr:CapA family protein [Nitrososphaeria archaeon]